MTKKDLQDGMVVTFRNGNKLCFFMGIFYDIHSCRLESEVTNLSYYHDNLKNDTHSSLDIVRVSYMGKSLWTEKS